MLADAVLIRQDGEFVPDLSEDPALQQQRKSAWEAWQGTPVEPRASVAYSSAAESDGDGAGRDYKLISVRIERTLQFEKHAEYEIVTSYEAADSNGGVQESLVSRRYSEFRKLEKAISDVIEGLPVRILVRTGCAVLLLFLLYCPRVCECRRAYFAVRLCLLYFLQ